MFVDSEESGCSIPADGLLGLQSNFSTVKMYVFLLFYFFKKRLSLMVLTGLTSRPDVPQVDLHPVGSQLCRWKLQ